jgi:hypothetical protein
MDDETKRLEGDDDPEGHDSESAGPSGVPADGEDAEQGPSGPPPEPIPGGGE